MEKGHSWRSFFSDEIEDKCLEVEIRKMWHVQTLAATSLLQVLVSPFHSYTSSLSWSQTLGVYSVTDQTRRAKPPKHPKSCPWTLSQIQVVEKTHPKKLSTKTSEPPPSKKKKTKTYDFPNPWIDIVGVNQNFLFLKDKGFVIWFFHPLCWPPRRSQVGGIGQANRCTWHPKRWKTRWKRQGGMRVAYPEMMATGGSLFFDWKNRLILWDEKDGSWRVKDGSWRVKDGSWRVLANSPQNQPAISGRWSCDCKENQSHLGLVQMSSDAVADFMRFLSTFLLLWNFYGLTRFLGKTSKIRINKLVSQTGFGSGNGYPWLMKVGWEMIIEITTGNS